MRFKMNHTIKITISAALILSVIILIFWQVNGGDYYTKYQVVEEIEKELDPSDPLVAAGFYDNSTVIETVVKDEFRLGLLPTPSGLFDKHSIAVITMITPLWFVSAVVFFYKRKKRLISTN